MKTYPPPLRRMWNMRPWRKSPLMRTDHRIECLTRALLVGLVAAAAVLAVVVGLRTSATVTADAARTMAGARPVDAVLDAAPAPARFAMDNAVAAPARWSLGGRAHTGFAEVAYDAHKGDHATVWVRPDGDQLPAIPTRADAVTDGIGAGFTLFAGTGVLAVVLDWAICWSVARRRERAWETEWAGLAGVRRWNRI